MTYFIKVEGFFPHFQHCLGPISTIRFSLLPSLYLVNPSLNPDSDKGVKNGALEKSVKKSIINLLFEILALQPRLHSKVEPTHCICVHVGYSATVKDKL